MIVTLFSNRQPLSILTFGPMTQNGPISTSSAISASGSTIALSWILRSAEKKRSASRDENQFGRLGPLGFSFGLALPFAMRLTTCATMNEIRGIVRGTTSHGFGVH